MITSTAKLLLTWHEPVAISSPAPDYGVKVEMHVAENLQPLLRKQIIRDFAIDAGLSLSVAALCGILIAYTESGNFWHGFGFILAARVLTKLALKASWSTESWLDIPVFKPGHLEIYTDRVCWIESNKTEHTWPAVSIRQIRLKVVKHKIGVRRIMQVRFTRKRSYQILVPHNISFDSIEHAALTAKISVSRPKA